jgi:predicted transcriptional regulator
MQSVKQNAIKVIEQLPDESSFEDIMEKLLFLQKVEAGLEDIRQGRVISHDEVKKRLAQWLK